MSLVKGHWVIIGAAGLLAVALPFRMLGSAPELPPHSPLTGSTAVQTSDAGTLAYALTAPPFTQGRVPQPEAAEGSPADGQAAQPPAPPPALVGLVVGSRGRAVALARGANGQTLTLTRGEAIDGWIVTAIGRDRATFQRDGTSHTAELNFDNRTAAASPPPPESPPVVPAVSSGAPSRAVPAPRPSSGNSS